MLKFPSFYVVYGHSVSDSLLVSSIGPDKNNTVTQRQFEGFLKEYGSECVLTLDDGYASNLYNVLPVIERYKIAAKIFITTGFVERTCVPLERIIAKVLDSGAAIEIFSEYLNIEPVKEDSLEQKYNKLAKKSKTLQLSDRIRLQKKLLGTLEFKIDDLLKDMLSVQDVKMLDAHPLVNIGAHTVYHSNLCYVSSGELEYELSESRRKLETWLGRSVDEISYPYGANCKRVRKAAKSSGYKIGYSTERKRVYGFGSYFSRLSIPRHDINKIVPQ